MIFQSYNGTSLAGSKSFDAPGTGYVATAAYIGVIAIVLAVLGVALRRRRPVVIAFVAVGVVMGAVVYFPPLVSLLNQLKVVGEVRWVRAVQVMVFALAILAGVGMDVLVRSKDNRTVRYWLGGGFAGVGVVLLAVWAVGRGHLPDLEAAIRNRSFSWPAAEVVVGLVVFGFLVLMSRRLRIHGPVNDPLLADPSRLAGAVLLICSTGFLVSVGAPWWSSNTTYLKPTSSEVDLQKAVGSSLVGFGISSCLVPPTLGIQANVNIAYGVHEFDSYDPLTRKALYRNWAKLTGNYPLPIGPSGIPDAELSMFCPIVKTSAAARLFGISYVLEPHGKPGPAGSVFDTTVGTEDLYRIPGASLATVTPIPASGSLPGEGRRPAGGGDLPEPFVLEADHTRLQPTGPPPAPHRCSRMACVDRWPTTAPAELRRRDAAGPDTTRHPYDRAPLLAGDIHRRHRGGRGHRCRSRALPGFRIETPPASEEEGTIRCPCGALTFGTASKPGITVLQIVTSDPVTEWMRVQAHRPTSRAFGATSARRQGPRPARSPCTPPPRCPG